MRLTCSFVSSFRMRARKPQVRTERMCPRTDTHLNYMTGVALTAESSCCWRRAMSGADRVIGWSTAGLCSASRRWLRSRVTSTPAISCGCTVSLAGRLTWFRSRWTG